MKIKKTISLTEGYYATLIWVFILIYAAGNIFFQDSYNLDGERLNEWHTIILDTFIYVGISLMSFSIAIYEPTNTRKYWLALTASIIFYYVYKVFTPIIGSYISYGVLFISAGCALFSCHGFMSTVVPSIISLKKNMRNIFLLSLVITVLYALKTAHYWPFPHLSTTVLMGWQCCGWSLAWLIHCWSVNVSTPVSQLSDNAPGHRSRRRWSDFPGCLSGHSDRQSVARWLAIINNQGHSNIYCPWFYRLWHCQPDD